MTTKRFGGTLLVCLQLSLCAKYSSAEATLDFIVRLTRQVDGYPNSLINIPPIGIRRSDRGAESDLTLTESQFGAGSGFNRHVFLMSAPPDGNSFRTSGNYIISTQAKVTLLGESNSFAKEAGFALGDEAPVNDVNDIEFKVTSQGEIVAAGVVPYRFDTPQTPYLPGQTMIMGVNISGAPTGVRRSIQYFIDRGMGIESSPFLPWALPPAPFNEFRLAFYAEATPDPSNPTDFIFASFRDWRFSGVPEPGAAMIGALGALGLPLARRRFRRR